MTLSVLNAQVDSLYDVTCSRWPGVDLLKPIVDDGTCSRC